MERPLSFLQSTVRLSPSGPKSSKSHTDASGAMATFFWLWISVLRKMEKWLDKASLRASVWLALKACLVKTRCKNFPSFTRCYSGTCCCGSWPRKSHGKKWTLHIAVGLLGVETSKCCSRALTLRVTCSQVAEPHPVYGLRSQENIRWYIWDLSPKPI